MTEQNSTTTPSPAGSSAPAQTSTPGSSAPAPADDLLSGLPQTSEDHLRFDPFEYLTKKDDAARLASGQPKPIDPVDGSQQEDPLAPDAGGDPLQGDPVEEPPTNTPQAPQDMSAILEQMAVMRAELDQFRSNGITSPKPTGDTNPPQDGGAPKIPDYMYDVPDQIMAAMASEDPVQRKEGVKHLLGGIGRTIHRNIMREIATAQAQIPQMVTGMIKEQAYRQRIHDDFYGEYKDLNAPHLIPVVTATFGDLLQQGKVQKDSWSQKTRDIVAREVYKRLGRPFPTKGQPPVQKPQVPPKQIGGNRGPGAGAPQSNTADDIARTYS